MNKPQVLDLPSYADDRGVLTPVWTGPKQLPGCLPTELDLGCAGMISCLPRRAYFIHNSRQEVIRGFHFHDYETKYFVVLRGMAKFVAVPAIGDVQINGGESVHTFDENNINTFVLTDKRSQILIIPPGYANGWMSLTDDCLLLALSSSTFEQSKNDDRRYAPDLFGDVWSVEPR